MYGEAYGGKLMKMAETYGPDLRFVAFEVKIGDVFLNAPNAEDVCAKLGIEFVHWVVIPVTLESIHAECLKDSVQAVRNGMGEGHKREGVVLRPLIELRKNNDERIIVKYKRDDFKETKTNRPIDAEKLKVLEDAQAIADEWVTPMRLAHVLDNFPRPLDVSQTGVLVKAMVEDVMREGKGEIVDSKEARTAIGRKTAQIFKALVKKESGL